MTKSGRESSVEERLTESRQLAEFVRQKCAVIVDKLCLGKLLTSL